jgi:hypothetical protein
MLLYFLPDRRQRTSKSDDVFVFSALPHLAKKSVIAILFASLRIASRRLNVIIGKGHIHTSIHAGGIARALIRFSASASDSFDPSARV